MIWEAAHHHSDGPSESLGLFAERSDAIAACRDQILERSQEGWISQAAAEDIIRLLEEIGNAAHKEHWWEVQARIVKQRTVA